MVPPPSPHKSFCQVFSVERPRPSVSIGTSFLFADTSNTVISACDRRRPGRGAIRFDHGGHTVTASMYRRCALGDRRAEEPGPKWPWPSSSFSRTPVHRFIQSFKTFGASASLHSTQVLPARLPVSRIFSSRDVPADAGKPWRDNVRIRGATIWSEPRCACRRQSRRSGALADAAL